MQRVGPAHDEQVRRLQIAVHDPERVRLGQRLARLQHEIDGLLERQRATQPHPLGEVVTLEELHHHVRRAGIERTDVDHPRDVLARDLDGRARLAREALDRLGVAQRLREKELDRHLLVELQMKGGDDDAHPAGAEHALHAVLAGQDVALTDPRSHLSRTTVRQEAAPSEPTGIDPRPDERHGPPMSARFGGRVKVARARRDARVARVRGASPVERAARGASVARAHSALKPLRVLATFVREPPASKRACRPA